MIRAVSNTINLFKYRNSNGIDKNFRLAGDSLNESQTSKSGH